MQVGVPREVVEGEHRVALTPDAVAKLVERGLEVVVETGAGSGAGFGDDAYKAAGAQIADGSLVWGADVVLKVAPPVTSAEGGAGADAGADETARLREGAALIGFLLPLTSPALIRRLAERKITSFSMELVPRITVAQRMDALSSQATAAGYVAALEGALEVDSFFPMLTTAAGTIPPAKVLVIGAGVAGLQAIATARRLGARVKGFDIRPAAAEQVESLGAQFVGITMEEAETEGGYAKEVTEEQQRREHELLHDLCVESDVVITTAQVPGRKAPVLITDDMVADMRPGSVVVDLAAESGGNCSRTRAGETVDEGGVRIIGMVNPASRLPRHASQMYAKNVFELFTHLLDDETKTLTVSFEDEITRECCVTHRGEVVHARTRDAIAAGT
ncbi:MAG TPA: Re/Si-specific NAD(P)(+) transhydrogenase subunit alpha [Longimicrobiales bacterium]|nr:Re/Si-specific NAD(P)(+) transhydrogenase subunit alpha [Longimicrobiales bacterium]